MRSAICGRLCPIMRSGINIIGIIVGSGRKSFLKVDYLSVQPMPAIRLRWKLMVTRVLAYTT